MSELRATDDVVTTEVLFVDVFGDEVPDDLPATIGVCAGEWRREPDGRWRFWADDNFSDDEVPSAASNSEGK